MEDAAEKTQVSVTGSSQTKPLLEYFLLSVIVVVERCDNTVLCSERKQEIIEDHAGYPMTD